MPPQPRFTCPRCGMTSYNPNDVREGYCGNCHDWTGLPDHRLLQHNPPEEESHGRTP